MTRIPKGPPLHLERPGQITRVLGELLLPARLERLRSVADLRTRHLSALLEHVHDPHNIAACLRSADACGVQDVHVVTQDGSPLEMNKIVCQGTQRWVDVHYHASTDAALRVLKDQGYRVAATDLGGPAELAAPIELADVSVEERLCIAFGNEHEGISHALRSQADLRVKIPMLGFAESFNISVAFALSVHHLRHRHGSAPARDVDMTSDERLTLLDRWVHADVPRADAVLSELARRATLSSSTACD